MNQLSDSKELFKDGPEESCTVISIGRKGTNIDI